MVTGASTTRKLRGRRLGPRSLTALAAAATVTMAGLAAAPAGAGANDSSCPAATDLSTLAPGDPLHGLTVSKGSTPEAFTGDFIGVQKDGIVPGVDLVIVELSSPAIDEAGGVWQGMSGSPVYASDGSLVGAVSWGLSNGPSTIVGVTPAAEMQAMLDATPATARSATLPRRIPVRPRLERAIVGTGAVGPAAVHSGMRPLTVPLAISGLSSHRIDQLAKKASLAGVRPYSAPRVPTTASPASRIVAGGNLAASVAYGSFSAVAVGTATEVCGSEVIGFGHPILDIPRGDLTMHNADALYVQPDPLWQPYKVANISGPVGSLPDNLLPGIHGSMGGAPPATEVTSTSRVGTQAPRTGTTYISLRPLMPVYAAYSAISVEDRALSVDMFSWYGAPGSDLVTWTVRGLRSEGTPFSYTRTDRYASPTDIAYTWPWELHDQLNQLLNNETENVTITKVTTTSATKPVYQHLRIAGLEVRAGGTWQPVRPGRTLRLEAGTTHRFRVTMRSAALGTREVRIPVLVPKKAAGQSGSLSFQGGDDRFGEVPAGATVDRMLRAFQAAPRNDQVLVGLSFFGNPRIVVKDRAPTRATVGGGISVDVEAVR